MSTGKRVWSGRSPPPGHKQCFRRRDTLWGRLRERDGFPHEIGLFLGYPAEDVYGFLKYGGKNCKYTGCWKVYSDVDRALALFDRYRRCRSALCRRVSNGDSIIQMFCPS